MKKGKNNKGFTLVELLVVIAIIAILAVVAVPSLMKNINKAKVADIVADYSAIKAQVLATYADDSLVDGTYTKAMDGTTLAMQAKSEDESPAEPTTKSTTESIEVNDLSKEAEYSLVVKNQTAKLTITTKHKDIAEKVAEAINGNQTAKKVNVEILK
ncbi:type II secretion system protein [Romboutsia sp. CE17]|nr:type II secretion system protein [Romboutsia sp. CE17]QJA10245.1 type II secretion system protein [Romboutsia sp. CE17]